MNQSDFLSAYLHSRQCCKQELALKKRQLTSLVVKLGRQTKEHNGDRDDVTHKGGPLSPRGHAKSSA